MLRKLPTKTFSAHPGPLVAQPNLAEIQINSYKRFLKDDVRELLDEISPIKDYSGKELELHFTDFYLDEPKYDEEYSKFKDLTYEATLRVTARLTNNRSKIKREQEVYFGDFPVMTDRGTFIINGVERVVVSQLIRSSGVYFTGNVWRGRKLFGAKIIPNRGAWLEFETDPDGFIGVKIDRKRKCSAFDLLKIFGGVSNEDLVKIFSDVDHGVIHHVPQTIKKSATTMDETYLEIYKRLRPVTWRPPKMPRA